MLEHISFQWLRLGMELVSRPFEHDLTLVLWFNRLSILIPNQSTWIAYNIVQIALHHRKRIDEVLCIPLKIVNSL